MTAPAAPPSTPSNTPAEGPQRTGATPNERRARTRRSAVIQRAIWMSARARNAARRVALIASVGGAAVIATMLVLVLLPREVDRAIRAQLDAIPTARDTTSLLAAFAGAKARQAVADELARRSRVVAAASPVASLRSEMTAAADSVALSRDSLGAELQQRLNRARGAPLVESYRALAESPLLRDDSRIRAIIDSIEGVDREREAYAALGGPDARYATLTARLSALGQRVVRVGEVALADRQAALSPRTRPVSSPPPTPAPAPVVSPSAPINAAASSAAPPAASSTGLGGAAPAGGDSSATAGALTGAIPGSLTGAAAPPPTVVVVNPLLVAAAAAAADTVRTVQRQLDQTRRTNDSLEARRAQVRKLRGVSIPPLAMLGAALIVGLALGYGTAVVRELRRPTVGDEGEVERLAQARVVIHNGSLDAVRDVRTRRRADKTLPPALDPTAEAWQQLHLTLTGLGDVVRTVRVVSDQPLLAGTLAINLAAAAARESRATLLVEPPSPAPLLAMLLRQTRPRGILDVQQGRAGLREVVVETPMGRDVAVDVLFSGNAPSNPLALLVRPENGDEIRRIAARYDLTLVVGDGPDVGVAPADTIVCARLGSTSLEWLGRVTSQARADNHRLRAVLLWATDAPTV